MNLNNQKLIIKNEPLIKDQKINNMLNSQTKPGTTKYKVNTLRSQFDVASDS
jgi:hypothetical protein